ncbi:hypothetical protein ACWKSP_23285 [Micromonosporaceae bacterium Da 78-11]
MASDRTTEVDKSPWPKVVMMSVLLTALIAVLGIAFAWPAVRSSVHDVPIAVAGPATAAGQVTAALEQRMPGAFDVTVVADTAAAKAAILDRDVYGAIDVSAGAPQVLTAGAASPFVAQVLQQVAAGLAPAPGAATTTKVTDVVPLPADDPRGAGLSSGALPMIMGGLLAALLLTNLVRGTWRKVSAALGFAVLGGLALTAVLQFWLGSLTGDYAANAGVVALSVAAISLTLLGLESLLGFAGFGLGAALMMVIGNPLSGLTSAPELLPGWSGTVGQLLPPGAAGSLLRSTAFFDGAGAAGHIVVLGVWIGVGVVLCVLSGMRRARAATTSGTATQSERAMATVS